MSKGKFSWIGLLSCTILVFWFIFVTDFSAIRYRLRAKTPAWGKTLFMGTPPYNFSLGQVAPSHTQPGIAVRSSNGKFCEAEDSDFDKTKQFLFQNNRFHISKCSLSNQSKQREQSIMVKQ